jgi:hypothetical protein
MQPAYLVAAKECFMPIAQQLEKSPSLVLKRLQGTCVQNGADIRIHVYKYTPMHSANTNSLHSHAPNKRRGRANNKGKKGKDM